MLLMLILLLILLINIINNISNSRLRIYCLIYTPFPPFVCRPLRGLGLEMYRRFATYIEEGGKICHPPLPCPYPIPVPLGLQFDGNG